jgi:copper(I)-binding protein
VNKEAFAVIRARYGKTAAGRLLLGAGVLALLIPAIAGCEAGNGAPTLEFHPANFGANTTFNGIQITNAFVLGAPNGSTLPSGSAAGLFVSLYNSGSGSDTLLGATAPGTAGSISLSTGTVPLAANAAPVNLTGPEPKVVLEDLSQPLRGGSFIPVTFDFQHAGTVTLQVPVEAKAFQWATFSPPAAATPGAATPGATPSGTATPGAAVSTATATPVTSTGATGTATATPTATPTP